VYKSTNSIFSANSDTTGLYPKVAVGTGGGFDRNAYLNVYGTESSAQTGLSSNHVMTITNFSGSYGYNNGDAPSSICFRQRWWSGGSGIEAVGGVRGIKTSTDGNTGGGVQLLYFNATLQPGLTLNNSGNVGIGTASPIGGLHVRTTTQVSLYTEQYSGVGNQGSGIQCWNTNIFSPTIDNQMSCGWSTFRWTTVYATTGTINTSDSRQKMNISPSNLGLNFISNLNPVSYSWIDGGTPATEPNVVGARSGKRTFYGFLAQDVKKTLDVMGTGDFAGWTLDDPKDPDSTQGLRYTEFIAPMVKAIQELSAENTALKQSLASATARLDSLESRLAAAGI
jgi:hypothetical protein